MIASWPRDGASEHSDPNDERGPVRGTARTPAFSRAGMSVRRRLRGVEESRVETQYQGGRREELLRQLASLALETDDGPIDGASFAIAEMFLRSLSAEDLPGDVDVDPDGEATFDWGQPGNRLAVSVSSRWLLAFAGLFSGETVKGTEPFLGDQVPSRILDGIRRCRG